MHERIWVHAFQRRISIISEILSKRRDGVSGLRQEIRIHSSVFVGRTDFRAV